MADSKMQKRIFTGKPESRLIDPTRTPSCYYHKGAITHFCVKKKCTLPLCQECLPVHKREHISNKQIPNEGIIEFDTARDDALTAFQERREEIQKAQERFRNKVLEYRSKITELISGVLDKFMEDCLVTDGNLEIIAEIEDRTSEIKRGSLKELIRYYEDIHGAEHFRKLYKMYTGEYLTNFKFQLDRKALEKITKEGIKNLNFQAQQSPNSQPLQKAEEIEIKPKPLQQPPVKDPMPTHTPLQRELMPLKLKSEPNNPLLSQKVEAPATQVFQNKRIASEEDEESQISSYQLLKSKKRIEEGNIYTQNPTKLTQNHSNYPSKNGSNVSSTSKNKKKKGLSLAKSHKQLPNVSQTSNFSNFRNEQSQNQTNNRKSSWRQFVNMKQTHPENNMADIQSNEPTAVLNPKQMRDLIVKKKMEEKQRELKVNKSAELLIPAERIKD